MVASLLDKRWNRPGGIIFLPPLLLPLSSLSHTNSLMKASYLSPISSSLSFFRLPYTGCSYRIHILLPYSPWKPQYYVDGKQLIQMAYGFWEHSEGTPDITTVPLYWDVLLPGIPSGTTILFR
ncbi:uncharacterized protein BO95DRAFT_215199 [Aspergillus brunneoviolaceus CBS 621.78]|uniref:Uncharacterized protein n=1 Tax=Aspergillus brunneoviolaceus CBS 621.78 TaxID=1450534 RepID=A0ACD1G1V9_9EURO|nr:hypothetical protein BO95DRAFT_215199 [Aspergillus brunneoviolaceus CBS 621.78]RAH43224.1 hypothetical protein BO95DRAFT_215199 [Aspergillus brunneoviolaceus CBS 621.78]